MQLDGQVNDEALSAYLDNQLSSKERLAISAMLLQDPALQQRFAKLYAQEQTLKIYASTVVDVQSSPLSETADVLPLQFADQSVRKAKAPFSKVFSQVAIAASVALMVGLSTFWFSVKWLGQQSAIALDGLGNTATLLATQPSGQYQVDEQLLTLQLSFRHRAGGYCRVFNLDKADWQSVNIACQQGDAPWRLQYSQGKPTQGSGSSYMAASAAAMVNLDQIIDPMMQDQPLNAEAERQAIADGWR